MPKGWRGWCGRGGFREKGIAGPAEGKKQSVNPEPPVPVNKDCLETPGRNSLVMSSLYRGPRQNDDGKCQGI